MVNAITQALLLRTATVRKIVQQTQDQDPNSAQTIAFFDERSKQGLDAIDKLERGQVNVKQQRKELAKQRLAQLKEQLRMLQMFGGSPAALARQAAALAREIAAATRSYAGSDGDNPVDDSGLGGATSANDQTAAAGPANPSGEAASPTGDATQADSSDARAGDAASGTTTPAIPSGQANRATTLAQRSAEHNADRAFFDDAQNLLQQLRHMVDDAQRKDRQQHGKAGPVLGNALRVVGAAAGAVALDERTALSAPIVLLALPTAPMRLSV